MQNREDLQSNGSAPIGSFDEKNLNFESTFSGLDLDQITNFTDDALIAYLSTNIRVKKIGLSLIDNSLRDKLFALAAQTSNSSVSIFKSDIIKQIDFNLQKIGSGLLKNMRNSYSPVVPLQSRSKS